MSKTNLDYDYAVAIAQDLATGMKMEDGVEVIDRSKYNQHLPSELNAEQAEMVNTYNNIWAVATGLATGIAGTEYLTNNTEVTEVSVVSSLGHAEVSHKLYREYQKGDDVENNYLVSAWSQQTQGDDDYMARMAMEVSAMGANGEMEA